MQAYAVTRYGKGHPLSLIETSTPAAQAGQGLLQVHATALNQLDSKIKSGEFKLLVPYQPPFVLGHDVAGVVTAVGPGVRRCQVGDEVYARPADLHIGTFAEFIAVAEADVALKPANLTMTEAASLPLVALTAWQALVERAKLQKGQKAFIQAGGRRRIASGSLRGHNDQRGQYRAG